MIAQVRSFNRTVTQRVGALHGRVPRPRAASRRGAPAVGDRRRTAATSGRCGPGSSSTPATSAGCSARWRPTGSSRSAERRRTGGSARRGSRRPGARASRARPAQRRAGRLAPRARSATRQRDAPRRGDGRGRAAAYRRAWSRSTWSIRPHPAAQHCLRAYFAELDAPLRRRLRSRLSIPADARRAHDRRPVCCCWRRCGRARRLRRAEVPPRRAGRDQEDVGRRLRPRPRARPPSVDRARGSSRRPRRDVVRLETNRSLTEAIACTAPRATARSTRSTTSPTPTTGSRSGSGAWRRNPGDVGDDVRSGAVAAYDQVHGRADRGLAHRAGPTQPGDHRGDGPPA